MFAILKDGCGIPAVLFEITRETPKRYYGKVADTLDEHKQFYLVGLVQNRCGTHDYCEKDVVLGLVRTENAWYEVKENLASIKRTLKRRRSVFEDRANEARAKSLKGQAEAIVVAQNDAKAYLANVCV